MNIWLTRHGQTDLNKNSLMQGRTDAPLNLTGIRQAREVRQKLKDVHFDAVYASPLKRAVRTAALIAEVPQDEIILDQRLIEVNFGRYEARNYLLMGLPMNLFWLLPEVFPAPPTVEPLRSQISRAHEFLRELETKDYENVLVVCHGGILRSLKGYMEDRPNGILWRPKPKNCEVVVYESVDGHHRLVKKV